jgi:hypothetical protein
MTITARTKLTKYDLRLLIVRIVDVLNGEPG